MKITSSKIEKESDMAAITKKVQKELDAFADAANSGQLPKNLSNFIHHTVSAVYAAPGNFDREADMLTHLGTLTYLVNLHVNK